MNNPSLDTLARIANLAAHARSEILRSATGGTYEHIVMDAVASALSCAITASLTNSKDETGIDVEVSAKDFSAEVHFICCDMSHGYSKNLEDKVMFATTIAACAATVKSHEEMQAIYRRARKAGEDAVLSVADAIRSRRLSSVDKPALN